MGAVPHLFCFLVEEKDFVGSSLFKDSPVDGSFFLFSSAKFQKYFQSWDWFQVSNQAAVLLTDISLVNSLNLFHTCRLCERHSCFFLSKRGLSQSRYCWVLSSVP